MDICEYLLGQANYFSVDHRCKKTLTPRIKNVKNAFYDKNKKNR